LWPPGFFVFGALAHRLAGVDGPVALAVVLMTLAVWAGVFVLLFFYAWQVLNPVIAALLPVAILALPFMRQYMLGQGMFYSESLSAALWAIAFLLLMFGTWRRPVFFGVLAGLAWTAAAYTRAQVEVVLQMTTAIVVLAWLTWWFIRRYNLARSFEGSQFPQRANCWHPGVLLQFKTLWVALALFQVLTLPYPAYNYVFHNRFSWSFIDYYYRYLWTPPEDYQPIAAFIRDGGGPIGCAVEPETCRRLQEQRRTSGEKSIPELSYQSLTMRAMLKHPVAWVRYRLSYLPEYWFSSPSPQMAVGHDYVSGTVLAIFVLIALALLAVVPLGFGTVVLGTNWLALAAGTAAVFMFIHYEVRYLYYFQFAMVLMALVGIVQWRRYRIARQQG